jgi:hypothetical protein
MRRAPNVGEQHITLTTAVAVAYRDLMGLPLATTGTVGAWNATLHSVAKALSNVCPIFTTADDGRLLRVSMFDLSDGAFDHGGAILRLPTGTVYRRLSVSRDDLHAAITVLKRIGVGVSIAVFPEADPKSTARARACSVPSGRPKLTDESN